MKPKLSVGANERIHISPRMISNGHWAMTKNAAKQFRVLSRFLLWSEGVYDGKERIRDLRDGELTRIIPIKSSEYSRLLESVKDVKVGDSDEIKSFVFENAEGIKIAIDPKYVPVLRLGIGYMKDPLGPLLVEDNDGNFLAVIMPRRL